MINKLDRWLMQHPPRPDLRGARRFCVEFWFFGLKEARACLFAGLFFIAMFAVPRGGWLGVLTWAVLLPLLAQAALTVAIVTAFGPLVYRLAYQSLADATSLVLLIVSVGVHFALTGLGLLFFGGERPRVPAFTRPALHRTQRQERGANLHPGNPGLGKAEGGSQPRSSQERAGTGIGSH